MPLEVDWRRRSSSPSGLAISLSSQWCTAPLTVMQLMSETCRKEGLDSSLSL